MLVRHSRMANCDLAEKKSLCQRIYSSRHKCVAGNVRDAGEDQGGVVFGVPPQRPRDGVAGGLQRSGRCGQRGAQGQDASSNGRLRLSTRPSVYRASVARGGRVSWTAWKAVGPSPSGRPAGRSTTTVLRSGRARTGGRWPALPGPARRGRTPLARHLLRPRAVVTPAYHSRPRRGPRERLQHPGRSPQTQSFFPDLGKANANPYRRKTRG